MSVIKKIAKKILPKKIVSVLKNQKQKYKNNKYLKEIDELNIKHSDIEKKLRNRGEKPIRYACYVMYAADYGESDIFSLMINDNDFIPKLVVVPDVARGKEHMIKTYNETKTFLINKFGEKYILDGYDESKDIYIDHSDEFDIVSFNCPYDEMHHDLHKISYLNKKSILTTHTVYGYFISKFGETELYPRPEISGLWKIFLDTNYTLQSYNAASLCHGKNALAFGYPKMDALSKYKIENKKRKKILISPHHSINSPTFSLSNFLSYSDFILELPDLYPEIDFVFRPHPLLFANLVNNNFWTEKQVSEYLETIESKGIEYSHGGDYFNIFADCDAIIHDCASYITEWLFTGKPGCFVVRDDKVFDFFTELGKESVKYYKKAYNKEQIIDFINNLISDNNFMKYSNNPVIKNEIMLNYPLVSKKIVDFLRLR